MSTHITSIHLEVPNSRENQKQRQTTKMRHKELKVSLFVHGDCVHRKFRVIHMMKLSKMLKILYIIHNKNICFDLGGDYIGTYSCKTTQLYT